MTRGAGMVGFLYQYTGNKLVIGAVMLLNITCDRARMGGIRPRHGNFVALEAGRSRRRHAVIRPQFAVIQSFLEAQS